MVFFLRTGDLDPATGKHRTDPHGGTRNTTTDRCLKKSTKGMKDKEGRRQCHRLGETRRRDN